MPAFLSLAFAALITLAANVSYAGEPEPENRFTFHHEHVLGTSLEIRLVADHAAAATRAETAALAEIQRLAGLYSTYDPNSEFSRWQSAPPSPTRISTELFELLTAIDVWQARSQGTFQPGVPVLTKAWRDTELHDVPPTSEILQPLLAQAHQPHWKLDRQTHTALRLSDCPLSLDAIAKGDILERVCRKVLSDPAIRGIVLNIGGDIRAAGDLRELVAIADPHQDAENARPAARVTLRNQAVATSGNYRRGFRIGNMWYSHILDPRTGRPAEDVISATVIADSATDADALATICSVLSPAESLSLIDSLDRADCLLITRSGKRIASSGWSRHEAVPAQPSISEDDTSACDGETPSATPQTGMDLEDSVHELIVNFELARPADKAQYRRPYVAIWLEDEYQFPVKTALLWIRTSQPGPRWHRDLRRWFRHDQTRRLVNDTRLIGTISAATRGPGEYRVVFDGTDDEGKPLAPGQYTLFIEAAREHGTYQLIRHSVTLGDVTIPKTDLKGNVEIASATVESVSRPARPTQDHGR